MTFLTLSRLRVSAPEAGVALVSALIVLIALLAIPYHVAGPQAADDGRVATEDWRGNSARLR